VEALKASAAELVRGTGAYLVDSDCALGGGTTPTETMPSVAIAVPGDASALRARFLANDPPIVGRIVDDRFTIELRTLSERDRDDVRSAVAGLLT
jgi:seryl-tRNA(Sec) selenium transferase